MNQLEIAEKTLKEEYERVTKLSKEVDPFSEKGQRLSGKLVGLSYALGVIEGVQNK